MTPASGAQLKDTTTRLYSGTWYVGDLYVAGFGWTWYAIDQRIADTIVAACEVAADVTGEDDYAWCPKPPVEFTRPSAAPEGER